MELGYFFCGDLLGFSKIISNLGEIELNKRINAWVSLVEKSAKDNNITKYQLISDTVFAMVGSTKDEFKDLVGFARDLLNNGIVQSLLVRGAITNGNVQWGQLVYGNAVIKAHNLEKLQNWIGIVIDSEIRLDDQEYKRIGVVVYPVPMTSGQIKLFGVVSWNIPQLEELSKIMNSQGLTKAGEILDWGWANKLGNTIIFGLYLKLVKKYNYNPYYFNGLHSLHWIENEFNKIL